MGLLLIVICIIIITYLISIIISILVNLNTRECLVSRPNNHQRERMVSDIKLNKHIFENNKMEVVDARKVMAWMDAITFEDLRTLIHNKEFNNKNIYDTLS
jgi:uncharacterized membrane protein